MIGTNQLNNAVITQFVSALEQQNQLHPFIDQQTISLLAKSMISHLQHPQKLMQKLKNQFQQISQNTNLDLSSIDEPADKSKPQDQPNGEMADDLEEYLKYLGVNKKQQPQNSQTAIKPTPAKEECQLVKLQNELKQADSESQEKSEPDELSLQYEEECKLMELCKQEIKKSGQIHISGVYNEPNKKYNSKQENTKLSSPFFFIKSSDCKDEFLAIDVNCVLKDGENNELLAALHSI